MFSRQTRHRSIELENLTDHRDHRLLQEQDFFSLLSGAILSIILSSSGFAYVGSTEHLLQELDEKSVGEYIEMFQYWYERGDTPSISESIHAIVESDTKVLKWVLDPNDANQVAKREMT